MHRSKTKYGNEPNRLQMTLLCQGINNKQDASTLDVKSGECVDIVNMDIANTTSTRTGYTADTIPSTFTATSDQTGVFVNGIFVLNTDLGAQFSIATYKLPMINDRNALLEFYNGRLYALVPFNGGCTLYCSDPWDIDTMDERQCVVDTFDSVPKIIGRTDDGLVIGTDTEIVYLQGGDPIDGGLNRKVIALYGAIKNTLCRTTGDKVQASGVQGRICLFTTKQGVCVVGNGGSFKNLSLEKFSFDWSDDAAAFIREQQGQVHYIVSMRNASNSFNKETDNVSVQDSF